MSEPRSPALAPETAAILDSITDGVVTVDGDFRITSFNRAAESITGVPREDALGALCSDVFHADVCENDCALRKTMKTGESIERKPVQIVNSKGKYVPLSLSTAQLCDDRGRIIGGVETFRDLSALENLRSELFQRHNYRNIVSKSPQMHRLFSLLPNLASSDSTVLIEGPSGTGKELLAHAIHDISPRADKPLVVVNCGALPDTLLESELFGHVRGAFTDATVDREGRFALAEGGTIFLDEIGDVSPALQARLLRVIQQKTYEPVGSSKSVQADVRIITATNKDLLEETNAGRFREDLYYRINVVRLHVPSLAERPEDILLLAEHFIEKFNRQFDRSVTMMSDAVKAALLRHRWPGNVRELENTIEHAFILSTGPALSPQHLPEEILSSTSEGEPKISPIGRTLEELEAQIIVSALDFHGWRRQRTADGLGIDKTTLWRKMKRYGIQDSSPERD